MISQMFLCQLVMGFLTSALLADVRFETLVGVNSQYWSPDGVGGLCYIQNGRVYRDLAGQVSQIGAQSPGADGSAIVKDWESYLSFPLTDNYLIYPQSSKGGIGCNQRAAYFFDFTPRPLPNRFANADLSYSQYSEIEKKPFGVLALSINRTLYTAPGDPIIGNHLDYSGEPQLSASRLVTLQYYRPFLMTGRKLGVIEYNTNAENNPARLLYSSATDTAHLRLECVTDTVTWFSDLDAKKLMRIRANGVDLTLPLGSVKK